LKGPKIKTTLRVEPETKKRMEALATSERLTQGEVVDSAVQAYKPRRKK
jgi:predicted transcriptional regulator